MAEPNEVNEPEANEVQTPEPVEAQTSEAVDVKAPEPTEPAAPEPEKPKKSKKLKILIPIIAVAVVLVLIFAIILPAMRSSSYKSALALMEEGNYKDAKAGFEKLGDYMDSAWQAEVCENYIDAEKIYNTGMKQYSAGSWKMAEQKFNEILTLEEKYFNKEYKDTRTLVKSCQDHQKYDEAAALMANEDSNADLKKAAQIFQDLGDFEDAKANAEKCQTRIAQNDAYDEALEVLDQDNYEEAAGLFDALGDFKDSAEKAEDCRIMVDYEKALDLYNAGDYKEAIEAFEELESTYGNAASVVSDYTSADVDTLVRKAEAEDSLNEATKKFDDGDFEGASEILNGIDINFLTMESLESREKMLTTIKQKGDYDQAMKYYNNGRYYEAYKAFKKCEGYKDAADMAKKCAQPFPATGVVYMNNAYGDRSSELTINNTGFMNAYYKLYFGEDLVMTVFIPEDGIATFSLPSGNYKMTKCYGDVWYGTTDLFGDDGYYWVCSFGDSDTAPIEPGYAYEIKSGGEGTGIGTSAADRNSI